MPPWHQAWAPLACSGFLSQYMRKVRTTLLMKSALLLYEMLNQLHCAQEPPRWYTVYFKWQSPLAVVVIMREEVRWLYHGATKSPCWEKVMVDGWVDITSNFNMEDLNEAVILTQTMTKSNGGKPSILQLRNHMLHCHALSCKLVNSLEPPKKSPLWAHTV